MQLKVEIILKLKFMVWKVYLKKIFVHMKNDLLEKIKMNQILVLFGGQKFVRHRLSAARRLAKPIVED